MRKVTQDIAAAFRAQKSMSQDNTRTDGQAIYLFGNKIVERREGKMIFVSLGGHSYTKTTAERLSAFCRVGCRGGKLFLNGESWDGEWKSID